MSFTPLQKILPKAAAALGIKKEIDAAVVCEKYRAVAPEIIHREALDHTWPKFFRGKTLTIGVDNSAWIASIIKNKDILIKKINLLLGSETVKTIKGMVDVRQ